MFISTKTTSPHKDNLLAERIGNSETLFFSLALLRLSVHAYSTVLKKCEPCDTFFRNHERNRVPENKP